MKQQGDPHVIQRCKFNLAQLYESKEKLSLAKVYYEDANRTGEPKQEIM